MKRPLQILLISVCFSASNLVFAQGWRADVVLNVGSGFTPLASIDYARVSFQGAEAYGSSSTSYISLELTGEGTPTGRVDIYASGRSVYNSQVTSYISVTTSITIAGDCEMYYFDNDPAVNQYVSGRITVYPRLKISDITEGCDQVTLSSDICSNTFYKWEVSQSLSGPFMMINDRHAPIIHVTGDDMASLGLGRYGRKFFRVTGGTNTTSPIEVVDLYAPGSQASFSFTPPKCHDGADGRIEVNIQSSYPAAIDDFIVTVTSDADSARIGQHVLDNRSSVSIEGLKAGKYTIEVMNHSNTEIYGQCWTNFEVGPLINPSAVTVSSFEISDYNGYPIKCKGGSDGTLKVQPSGGTGTYARYSWTPDVSSTPNAENLAEGIYKVRVQDSNNCWSEEYHQTLMAPEKLLTALESTGGKGGFDVSCQDKADGVITTAPSGGVPAYTYQWSTGDTSPTLTAADTGMYQLTVTDGNGCTTTASLTLNAPEAIDFSIGELGVIRCAGGSTGALQVQSVVNTIGQVYYSWSSGESGKEITDKGAGTYSLTVSDEQGCQQTRSKTLNEPLPYSVDVIAVSDFNGSPIKCHGEANGILTTIVKDENQNIVPAEYYSWYRNENEFLEGGTSHAVLDLLSAGTYTVKIGYNGVCEAQKTFFLTEPDPVLPLISAETDYNGFPISCHGESDGSIQVTATGGTGNTYTWTWQSGETGQTLDGLAAGTYSVTARDVNGCQGTIEKILIEPPPVETAITVLSNYNGQPITCTYASDARLRGSAKGGTSLFNYSWNTGNTTQELTDVPAGIYTFTAVDANGCGGVAEMTITNPVAVKAEIAEASDYHGFGVSCHGTTDGFLLARGSGGTGTYTFEWNGGAYSNDLYKNLRVGKYMVRVADQNGCSDTTATVIDEPPILTLSASGVKNVSCDGGADGEIQLSAEGGAGEYVYSDSGFHWQSGSVVMGLKAGMHQVVVRDANGCQETIYQELSEPPSLSIEFENIAAALCGDPRGQVSARVTGGTGGYQYEWTGSEDQFISDQKSISGLIAGIYTLKVRDDHFCETMQSVGISSIDGPEVRISNIVSPSCSYSTDGRAVLEVTKGDGPFTFLWEDGQETPQGIGLGKGDHFVEITDTNHCRVVKLVTIAAPDSLELGVVEKATPKCYGDCNGRLIVAAHGGTGSYLYDWGNFTGAEADHLCAGKYHVKVMDEKGCISEKTFVLPEPPPLNINLRSVQPIDCRDGCDGSLTIEASGGTGIKEYRWSTGINGPVIDNLCPGSYTSTIIDGNHCITKETFVMENTEGNRLDLGGSITLCEGQTHILDPGNFWESYAWNSNTGVTSDGQRITISESGIYWLEAMSSNGCLVRDTFFLETSEDLLQANFLLASEGLIRDTVVLIDISWPLPENSIWHFPPDMDRMRDYGDIIYGTFHHEGQYEISLAATLGECRDEITKSITILNGEKIEEEGRMDHERFVKEFTLYPNPNDGIFDVKIAFVEERAIVLTIWNTLTATMLCRVRDSGLRQYMKRLDLRPLSAGNYTLRLDYGKGTKYLRFIVR